MPAPESFAPMKAFLVNLLVVFSLTLCGFNAYQWYREAKLHGRMEALGRDLFQKSSDIQNLQSTLQQNQDEIRRLDSFTENFRGLIRSNRLEISRLESESEKIRTEHRLATNRLAQADQYREAFEKANENLKKQNEIIQTQNAKMLEIVGDRNEWVGRYNKLATDYKSLGDDYTKVLGLYTNLVAQVQAANAKN